MGWRGELLPEAMPNIKQHLRLAMSTAAISAGATLDQHLIRGSRSGKHYKGMPAQSSAQDEWPQEQTGELRRALDIREGKTDTEMLVGFFDADEKKLLELEFNPPEKGGRPLLGDHFNDRDTLDMMNLVIDLRVPKL